MGGNLNRNIPPPGFFIDNKPLDPNIPPQGFVLDLESPNGFLDRFQTDVDRRVDMFNEILDAQEAGEQTTAESYLQVAGKVGAGAILDFIGEGLVEAGKTVVEFTPESIKSGVSRAAVEFLNSDIGKKGIDSINQGAGAYKQFREENPRAARNIESVVNVAFLLFPAKTKTEFTEGTLSKTATKLDTAAIKQTEKSKKEVVDDLILPKQTPTVRADQALRTTEKGFLRRKVVVPSKSEQAVSDTVLKHVPKIDSGKTLQGNLNEIQSVLFKQADDLQHSLLKNDVPISRVEILKEAEKVKSKIKANPLIVGDAEKTADKILAKMDNLIRINNPTASGLLKSRKELDKWVKSQKSNIFDSTNENALTISLREIRSSANDLIAKKVTDLDVKESLRIQSNLYRALENIAPKAGDEGINAVARLWQNSTRVLTIKSSITQQLALAFGMGGLGAAAFIAPGLRNIFLAGILTYATGKALMSPQTKKALSVLLKLSERVVKSSKNPSIIKQVRADRSLLLEILKQGQNEPANIKK